LDIKWEEKIQEGNMNQWDKYHLFGESKELVPYPTGDDVVLPE